MPEIKLIPSMSDDNRPSPYTASASSVLSIYKAYKSFDLSGDTWIALSSTGWLKIDLGKETTIDQYNITAYNSSITQGTTAGMPKNWQLKGSNDNSTWTIIDTQTNHSWTLLQEKKFYLSQKRTFRYYMIDITMNNGHGNLCFGKLQLVINVFNKFLIQLNDGKYGSIKYSGGKNEVPTMTSTTLPSGEALSSSTNTTAGEWKAFDGDSTTYWQTSSIVADAWIRYKFYSKVVISSYAIKNNSTTLAPKNFILQGSDDGVNFIDLDTDKSVTDWVVDVEKVFNVKNQNAYQYYRLYVKTNNGGGSIRVNELKLISPKDDSYKIINTLSETNIINHGIDTLTELDLASPITNKQFVEQSSIVLGSGKVFKITIDTSKIGIKNASIK